MSFWAGRPYNFIGARTIQFSEVASGRFLVIGLFITIFLGPEPSRLVQFQSQNLVEKRAIFRLFSLIFVFGQKWAVRRGCSPLNPRISDCDHYESRVSRRKAVGKRPDKKV